MYLSRLSLSFTMSVLQRFPQTLIFYLKWQNMTSLWRRSRPIYNRCEIVLWSRCAELIMKGVLKVSQLYSFPFLSYARKRTGVPFRLPSRARVNPQPPGGRIRPPRFFRNNFFIYYCINMEQLAHLSGHKFGVVSCKENQNRPNIFCYRLNFVTSLHAILGR